MDILFPSHSGSYTTASACRHELAQPAIREGRAKSGAPLNFRLGVTHMSEKQAIEKATAEGFLVLYNQLQGTDFQIVEMSDAPDVRCVDSLGKTLNLEITTTEDRPGDIKAVLGRSNGRSLEALRAHVERVARGEEQPQFSSLSDEVSDQLVERLQSKMMNDYGSNAALVVRDTSGVDWDWDDVIPAIRCRLDLAKNPFSQGIWVLSRVKDRLFQIK